MNIFALADDPVNSAKWQHDKHVVKMTLESAQLISTAVRLRPDWATRCEPFFKLYKPTHQNHPCTKWARMNSNNFRWLCEHGLALANEYSHRFWRTHKSKKIIEIGCKLADKLSVCGNGKPTEFPLCMPDEYKSGDHVLSYRLYYLGEKIKPDSKWTNRRAELPDWLFEKALLVENNS